MPFWVLGVGQKLFPRVFPAFMEAGERQPFPEIYRLIFQAQGAQTKFQVEVKIGGISVSQIWNLTLLGEATTLTFFVLKHCTIPDLHSGSCEADKAACEICIQAQVWILNRPKFQTVLGAAIWFFIIYPLLNWRAHFKNKSDYLKERKKDWNIVFKQLSLSKQKTHQISLCFISSFFLLPTDLCIFITTNFQMLGYLIICSMALIMWRYSSCPAISWSMFQRISLQHYINYT